MDRRAPVTLRPDWFRPRALARFVQLDVPPLQDGQVPIFAAIAHFAPDLPVRNGR